MIEPKRGAAPPRARELLRELHAAAERTISKPPTPEQRAAFEQRHKETIARIGAVRAWENVKSALLVREKLTPDQWERFGAAWDAWAEEKDPHKKVLAACTLAEHVAGLWEHADAVERELQAAREALAETENDP